MKSTLLITMLGSLLLSHSVVDAEPLRVMSYNIRHGWGMDSPNHEITLERTARVIADQKPDVVLVQEVDKKTTRSNGVDQAEKLASLLEMQGIFGKAINFAGGEYGLAVFTKGEILSHQVHLLPGEGEQRIALEVRIRLHGREFTVIDTHLDYQDPEKVRLQAKTVSELGKELPLALLAGDFNVVPGKPPLAEIEKLWTPVPKSGEPKTYPADKPGQEIDHLFIRGFEVVEKVQVIAEPVASDHRPIIATLKFPDASAGEAKK